MAGSGTEPEAQWPPRSPHDVLLSTPGGRERLRRMAERASPSPSPSKRARYTPALPSRSGNPRQVDLQDDDGMDLDDDEDEETLQLKLQAIQAKLKLKKLQSAKAKKDSDTGTFSSRPESAPIPDRATASRTQPRAIATRPGTDLRPQSEAEVQVPASPVRRAQTSQEHTSPSRIRLGIDKGLRAQDVSLKRAPSLKKGNANDTQNGATGGYLRRTRTPAPSEATQERPRSFSERLAAARSEEGDRKERQERVKQARTSAFQLGKQEMEAFKSNAKEIPDVPLQEEHFSREEVMAGGTMKRGNNTVPSLRRPTQDPNRSGSSLGASDTGASSQTTTRKKNMPPAEVPEEDASGFEPYSSVHLSKRIIPHPVMTRNLSGKKTYVIKDILKHVKAPDFELPEIEQDIVIFGILASKSEPRSHRTNNPNLKEKVQTDPDRGKYMVLKLVDLQWELDLFLFNSGFERYWKLTTGTLIAILNPTIMPPPPGRTDTGRFSLVVNNGDDAILEVGTARDLGFCKSVKKDGALCNSWINKKRTEFCEFHMNTALTKHRQARQDLNAFNTGLGPGGSGSGDKKYKNSYRLHGMEAHANDPNKHKRGNFDRDTGSRWFMHKPSAAWMLDNEVLGGGQVAGQLERTESLRRRLATEEKERELMKKLGKVGSGAGKEYMISGGQKMANSKNGSISGTAFGSSLASSSASTADPTRQLDARALGLIPEKGKEMKKIHLSPVKRKRTDSAMSGSTATGTYNTSTSSVAAVGASSRPPANTGGLGWGGNLKDKLSRMKEGEKLRRENNTTNPFSLAAKGAVRREGTESEIDRENRGGRDKSPARKKTRFVTEKGIREAGRESLGLELTSTNTTSTIAGGGGGGGGREGGRRMVMLDDDDDDEEDGLLILDS
ncbi:hypothetical protein F4778DRAFT_506384 [Xylariomycetidae sp. FL2044]|nr:hypothetical protein F4778DRAFT_506384 [Xylariomycetidae sp. FL2044]